MRKSQQFQFEGEEFKKPKDVFGGSHLKNSHAKTKRPIDSKLPLHLVLRSSQAKGKFSMRNPLNFRNVNETVRTMASKYGIRIYSYANAGNHVHLLIKISSPRLWRGFIRELTGRLSQLLQKLGPNERSSARFWDQRPFTRIVRSWIKAFVAAKKYVQLNHFEAEGTIRIEDLLTLKELRRVFADG